MWKAVFLGCIVFRTVVKLVGAIDQCREVRTDREKFKQKYNEYQRRDVKAFERQIKSVIESIFAEINTTNIRKQFYKKRDLISNMDDNESELPAKTAPIYVDKYGEELVDHVSRNTMNTLILANAAKQ